MQQDIHIEKRHPYRSSSSIACNSAEQSKFTQAKARPLQRLHRRWQQQLLPTPLRSLLRGSHNIFIKGGCSLNAHDVSKIASSASVFINADR